MPSRSCCSQLGDTRGAWDGVAEPGGHQTQEAARHRGTHPGAPLAGSPQSCQVHGSGKEVGAGLGGGTGRDRFMGTRGSSGEDGSSGADGSDAHTTVGTRLAPPNRARKKSLQWPILCPLYHDNNAQKERTNVGRRGPCRSGGKSGVIGLAITFLNSLGDTDWVLRSLTSSPGKIPRDPVHGPTPRQDAPDGEPCSQPQSSVSLGTRPGDTIRDRTGSPTRGVRADVGGSRWVAGPPGGAQQSLGGGRREMGRPTP